MKGKLSDFTPDATRMDLIDRIDETLVDDELNDWEEEFLKSIRGQVMQGRTLSEKQMETLDKIEYVVAFGRDYW
jgi:hypothetical protein